MKHYSSRTAVVRTRTPGGVTGKARESLPMSIVPVLSYGEGAYAIRTAGPFQMSRDRIVQRLLRDDFLNEVAMYIRDSKVTASKSIRQSLVVQP